MSNKVLKDRGKWADARSAELGAAVKKLRSDLGISQAELGRRCGMGQGRISAIECGRTRLTVPMLVDLAEALGVEVVIEFVGEDDGKR